MPKYKLVKLSEVFETFSMSERVHFLKLNSDVELVEESKNYVVSVNGILYYAYSGEAEQSDADWRYKMTEFA